MKNKIIKTLFVCVLAIGCLLTASNTKAFGYIYDSDKKPIQSSPGLVVTTDGVYNVNSTAWNGKIAASEITDFSDLYVYNNGLEEIIYAVDASSNILFEFDSNLNFLNKITKFEVIPDNFTDSELISMNTKIVSNGAKVSTALTNTKTNFWNFISEVKAVPYEQRTEDQKLYIECLGLSSVYRTLRPELDENNVKTGEYQDLIYLCDKNNAQILIVDAKTYQVVQVVKAPAGADFATKFAPSKMVTDSSGRMYVISDGVYEGIILMSYQGVFMRYVGVNYTALTFWQALTRNLKTEEQLAQETTILSTEFKNLTIDAAGFLYTVSRASTNPITETTDDKAMVKRINQAGNDVLVRNGYEVPKGDLVTILTGNNRGGSQFSAITVNEFGVYTIADSKMGRLFTYDDEGNLLYISGGNGNEQTDINNPVAVRYQGDNVLVLDKGNCSILRFKPTDFANSINRATRYQYYGDSESAANEWANVITANPNYQLAYVGVGKSLLEAGRYQEAMAYFELGDDVAYYSRAYKKYRDGIIKEYFPIAMYVVLGVAVLGIGITVAKKMKKRNKDEEGDII